MKKHVLALIGLISLIGLMLAFKQQAKKPTEQRPNIIYIMADDMGYSDIGCYGSEINTPNIDQLAANGIKTRSFYNNAKIACPSQPAL